jgi:chromosome partitioning protein
VHKEENMQIISVANQKGGVGKTTSVHNIGAALAQFHKKNVLMVDMDPQGNLTDSCDVDPNELKQSVYEVLDGKLAPTRVIASVAPRLDLLPANQDLASANQVFNDRVGRENLLKMALQKTAGYDIVLIDCPPALGLLTINAFVASRYILVPIQAEYHALAGFDHITNTLEKVLASGMNSDLQLLGVFVTFFDARKRLNTDVAKKLQEKRGDLLFKTKIRDNIALADAPSHGQDIFAYRAKCFGSEDYKQLSVELLKKLKEKEG